MPAVDSEAVQKQQQPLDYRHAIRPTDCKVHIMFTLHLQHCGLLRQLFSDNDEQRSLSLNLDENDGDYLLVGVARGGDSGQIWCAARANKKTENIPVPSCSVRGSLERR